MISPAPAAASGHNGSNGSCRRLHKPFFLSPLKLYNPCLRIPKHPSYLRPWTISGVPILVQQAPFSHLKIIRLSCDSFKQPLYLACHAFARNLYPLDSTKSLNSEKVNWVAMEVLLTRSMTMELVTRLLLKMHRAILLKQDRSAVISTKVLTVRGLRF